MPIPIDWTKVFSHSSSNGQLVDYHRQLEAYFDANERATRESLDDPGALQSSPSSSTTSSKSEGNEEVVP